MLKKKVALLLLIFALVTVLAACFGGGDGGDKDNGGNSAESGGGSGDGDLGDTITITFDSDGGSQHAPLVLPRYGDNSLSGNLPTPTKTGYKFKGWYEGGTEVTDDRYIGYDCTLTASWEIVFYNARLHLEDRFADTLEYSEYEYSVENEAGVPQPDSRYGYSFAGWYADAAYTTKIDAIGNGTSYLCDIDLYGKFEVDPFDMLEYSDGTCAFKLKSYSSMAEAITSEELASLSTIVIPTTYNGKPVTKIAYMAFAEWSDIESIVIPEGILEFSDYAALDDTAITSLALPDSLQVIDISTISMILGFNDESVVEYEGGKYVATATNPYAIFAKPVSETPITSINFHADTKIIGPSAFVIEEEYNNNLSHSLQTVRIPDKVKSICEKAFAYCYDLIAVEIGPSVEYMDPGAFYKCNITHLSAPVNVLTQIPCGSLKNLTLTGGTEIGEDTLEGCTAIESIALNDSITSIHKNAFDGITTLKSVQIGTGVTSIEQLSFIDKVAQLPKTTYNGCTYIGNITNPYFILYSADDNVTMASIHADTKLIWKGAFASCDELTQPTIPESVVEVGSGAFSDTAMRNWGGTSYNGGLYVGNTANPYMILTGIDSTAAEFVMQADIQCVASGIFRGKSNLVSVTLGKGVTKIEAEMFKNCTSLETVYLPDGVTEIGDYAFQGCKKLANLRIPDTVTKIGRNIVYFEILHDPNPKVHRAAALYYDGNDGYYLGNESNRYLILYALYTTSTNLQHSYSVNEKTEIVAPNVLRSNIYEVKLTDNVRVISDYAFGTSYTHTNAYSEGLYKVVLGNGLQYIGDYAFAGCKKLSSAVALPNSLTYLGKSAFYQCEKIPTLTIGTGLTEISDSAFALCNSLKTVVIPSNIRVVGESAFFACMGMQTVSISSSVTTVGSLAFSLPSSATVNCGASQKPEGWAENWAGQYSKPTINWGRT